jgi:hypothetical protein
VYYRLRQVDVDGSETFGPVVAVEATAPTSGLVVYPSVTAAQLTVVVAAGTQLSICDQLGQPWQQVTATTQPVNVQSLPSGVYVVRNLTTGQSSRFVKVNAQ